MSRPDHLEAFAALGRRDRLTRGLGEDLAPVFALVVEGKEVTGDLARLIRDVSFESSIDIADQLEVTALNPGFALSAGPDDPPDLIAHKAFQPGNEASLYLGYGRADTFVGRAVLAKHLPRYPQSGVPTLTVRGYDKSYLMANMEGVIAGGAETRAREAKPPESDAEPGSAPADATPYVGLADHEIVEKLAERWGLEQDIEPAPVRGGRGADEGLFQPAGMSDLEMIRSLANLNDREFWIDWDEQRRRWVLHWRSPLRGQVPELRFVYGDGDRSTLLSFEPEYGIRDNVTQITVLAWDEQSQSWIALTEVEDAMGPDPKWTRLGGRIARAQRKDEADDGTADSDDQLITRALDSATRFRMAAAGVAIDVVTGRPFRSLEEAANYARRWFQMRKDGFITARGRVVGVETLKRRQVHLIEGVGRLSGVWQFNWVKHLYRVGGGGLPYTCEFQANKVMP